MYVLGVTLLKNCFNDLRFDDSATPPQVNVNEDLALGETVVNVRSVPGKLSGIL